MYIVIKDFLGKKKWDIIEKQIKYKEFWCTLWFDFLINDGFIKPVEEEKETFVDKPFKSIPVEKIVCNKHDFRPGIVLVCNICWCIRID
jgi:hypothetical protein